MARVTAAETTARARAAVPRRLGAHERGREVGPSRRRRCPQPTSLAVLVDGYLRYDFRDPKSPANDRLVFSKGHASTLLYAMYRAAGVVSDEDILEYRKLGSMLEGHPTPAHPVGRRRDRLAGPGPADRRGDGARGKHLEHVPNRVWVLCGDSEMAEGSMWEAFEHAAHYELDNLTAIIDVNRLGQRGETMVGWDLDVYAARAEAFGWNAIEIDGHDLDAIDGRSSSGRDDRAADRRHRAHDEGEGRRGRGEPERLPRQTARRPGRRHRRARRPHGRRIEVAKPETAAAERPAPARSSFPRYELGTEVATRKAYGDALAALGAARPDVVALDGEVSNSTFAETFAKAHPSATSRCTSPSSSWSPRPSGCRQSAGGRSRRPSRPSSRARTTSCAWRRSAARRSRSAARTPACRSARTARRRWRSRTSRRCAPSTGATVLHPCDANQTAKLVAAMADTEGISCLRTLRPATPVLYSPDEEFAIGGSRVLRSSDERRGRARSGPGSRCTRRCGQPTRWPRRESPRASSTSTRSSRSTRRRSSAAAAATGGDS